jgi:hypothetical protein
VDLADQTSEMPTERTSGNEVGISFWISQTSQRVACLGATIVWAQESDLR